MIRGEGLGPRPPRAIAADILPRILAGEDGNALLAAEENQVYAGLAKKHIEIAISHIRHHGQRALKMQHHQRERYLAQIPGAMQTHTRAYIERQLARRANNG